MKVSIIIAVLNSAETLERTIKSIRSQSYKNIEIVFVDNNSNDGSKDIITNHLNNCDVFISERDEGLYDAINKGIENSTGELITILHSDNLYAKSTTVATVVDYFKSLSVDIVYGDMEYFSPKDPEHVVRKYKSGAFSANRLAWGFMPGHPSMFIKREIYMNYGNYNTYYNICADYEFLCRIIKKADVKYYYEKNVISRIQAGGISNESYKSNFLINKEMLSALKANNIYSNYFMLYSKYFIKIFEYFRI